MALYSLPPEGGKSQSNHEKNVRQIPIEGYSTKSLTSTSQNYQGQQEQGKPKKLPQTRGA